jgi:hypothetical protein
MRTVFVIVYVAMALWLMISAAARVAIQLASGLDLDALPFISGGLGLVGLVLLLPAYEDRKSRRRD